LHGTLDVLVLKTLTWGPMHGYAIADSIEHTGNGELVIVDAALYKSLHRLAESGAIDAEWGLSDNNRKAKYYSLTPRGRAQLRAETATWRRYASAVGRILEVT
ncbi:MAG TPA: PadR family transcriptional regulator, partial [Gemmatimonadaceae bacterium]